MYSERDRRQQKQLERNGNEQKMEEEMKGNRNTYVTSSYHIERSCEEKKKKGKWGSP